MNPSRYSLKLYLKYFFYWFAFHFTVYLEVGPDTGSYITLTFSFGTGTTISRYWEIHVTQHECTSQMRPFDSGCLQYHVGSAGRFQSFNFAQTTSSLYGHLHSQKWVSEYCVCTERSWFTYLSKIHPTIQNCTIWIYRTCKAKCINEGQRWAGLSLGLARVLAGIYVF